MASNHCTSVCKLAQKRCNTKVQLHEVRYVWAISNFDFHEAEGSALRSPTFSADTNDKIKWFLEIKPNGETDAKDFVSILVCLSPDSIIDGIHKKVYAKCCASLLDREQKELFYLGAKSFDKVTIFEYGFPPSAVKSSWCRKEFLKKNDDFRNNLLSNNELTIIFRIIFSAVCNDFTNTVHSCNAVPLYPNVAVCNHENFEMLFENHEFADVVLSVKDNEKEYPAHKAILAAHSSVFAAMFRHNLKESETNRIEIEDMNEEVVAEMLRYIYTGKCENCEELADGLLAAADKYDLDRLKMICAEALYKTLSVDNAANILALADLHCVAELKSETMKFMVARFADVVVSTAWKNILVSNPELINEVCQAVAGRSPAPKRRRIQDTC